MELEPRARTRLAVVGSDLKFITPLIVRLEDSDRFEVRIDEWPKFRVHDEEATRDVLAWADTIVCEWAGPNAVLASRVKRPHQRLIVRLHRVELSYDDWREIDIAAVDTVVTVGPYYRRRVLETTGWPEDKVLHVPNAIDTHLFDRPKPDEARFHLGMIGAASARKRLDLAMEVLALLRGVDERYQLFVKGSNPWEIKWVADRPEETAYFADVAQRLTEPDIAGAVSFDPPGEDVPEWLERVGFVLSTSDDESFHLSPAEGMASRAIPVVRSWPGADEIYDAEWVTADIEEMAKRILAFHDDPDGWRSAGERARHHVVGGFDLDEVATNWIADVLEPRGGRNRLRVSVVSDRNPYLDTALMALIQSLDSVGHHVSVISGAEPIDDLTPRVTATRVGEPPTRFSRRWLMDRLRGGRSDEARRADLAEALLESQPHLVYPHKPGDIDLAEAVSAPTMRMPTWPIPRNDMISVAPDNPALSSSPTTGFLHRRLPTWPSYRPAAARLEGHSAVLVYRVTPTSPGRYLEAAMRRAGIEVSVMDARLDMADIDPDADFVVIVESAYPAFEVTGAKPAVPFFFWAHHGEHHLPANLRLAHRYRADAVLMAHSWHLAHRFPVPTHRFPFAVASELDPGSKRWPDRAIDVAMVGSGIGSGGSRYRRRREIVEQLSAEFETEVAYGLRPEEMMTLYGNSRIVVNDGGPKHFPITMRVFETLGAGSLLLTEDIPGTDTLLERETHYVALSDDPVGQVREILADPGSAAVAAGGHEWAMERHTYDHRVDLLVELASGTPPGPGVESSFPPMSPMGRLIDQDVEVQQIAVYGETDPLGLGDRAMRDGLVRPLGERSIDAVVIGHGALPDIRGAVLAARGYVYAVGENLDKVVSVLGVERADASVTIHDGLLRADLGGTPYRARPADHPLSS